MGTILPASGQGNRNVEKNRDTNVKMNDKKIVINVDKIRLLSTCLCSILQGMGENKQGIFVWRNLQGFECLITLIGRLGTYEDNISFSSYFLDDMNEQHSSHIFPSTSPMSSRASASAADRSNVLNKQTTNARLESYLPPSTNHIKGSQSITSSSLNGIDRIQPLLKLLSALLDCIAVDMKVSALKIGKNYEINNQISFRNDHTLLANALTVLIDQMFSTISFPSNIQIEEVLCVVFRLVRGRSRRAAQDFQTAIDHPCSIPTSTQPVYFSESSLRIASPVSHEPHPLEVRMMNPEAAEVIIEMLSKLPAPIGIQAIKMLQAEATGSVQGALIKILYSMILLDIYVHEYMY